MNILENFVSSMNNNVVLRDSSGKPSIFVRHPKINNSAFDPSLPDTPHPAFKFGEETDSAVLIGKYAASSLISGGTLYSLPNADPIQNIGYSTLCTRAESFPAATALTIADYGLLILLAQKYGIRIAHGNTANGNDKFNGKVSTIWTENVNVTAGTMVLYLGWVYECLISHKMGSSHLPTDDIVYWRSTGQKLGGTACYTDRYGYVRTLTGSGPLNWYFNDDINNEADLFGNTRSFLIGARIYQGEIQIVPSAGDPGVDVSEESEEWKAILPHNSDNGYDLVAPGTSGTVHYAWVNNEVTLIGRTPAEGELPNATKTLTLYDIKVESSSLPYVPHILYELALAPLNVSEEHKVSSYYAIPLFPSETYRYPLFGNMASTSNIGVANLIFNLGKDDAMRSNGIRQRVRVKT